MNAIYDEINKRMKPVKEFYETYPDDAEKREMAYALAFYETLVEVAQEFLKNSLTESYQETVKIAADQLFFSNRNPEKKQKYLDMIKSKDEIFAVNLDFKMRA